MRVVLACSIICLNSPCPHLKSPILPRSRCRALRVSQQLLAGMRSDPECRQQMQQTLSLVSLLLYPEPAFDASPRYADTDPDEALDEAGEALEGHGEHPAWAVREPWQHQVSASRLTLRFQDECLEARFRAWHSRTMCYFDAFGYAVCLGSLLYILHAPGTPFELWAKADYAVNVLLHGVASLLPGALLMHRTSRRWYRRHREALLAFTFGASLV